MQIRQDRPPLTHGLSQRGIEFVMQTGLPGEAQPDLTRGIDQHDVRVAEMARQHPEPTA